MHDVADFESKGIPAVFVASDAFEQAAAAQARALGFDPVQVLVPHPIQDRTDREIEALADAALEELLAALIDSRPRP